MPNKINRIFAASIGYTLGGLLIKGIAFITTPIFSRLLAPEEFGAVNIYLAYEAIIAMLIGFQFPTSFKAAKIEFAQHVNGLNAYLSKIIFLLIFHSLVILVFINLFPDFMIRLTGIKSLFLLNLLVVNCLGNALVTVYNSYVSLSYHFLKYLKIALVNASLNVLISLALIFTVMDEDRSTARILGYIIPYTFISIYIIFCAYKQYSPKFILRDEFSNFAYRYCVPLIPAGFAEVILVQFGKLTVERSCGYYTMGIFSLSYNVYSIIGVIRLAMDYIIGPFFFDKRANGEIKLLQETIKMYSRMLVILTIFIMLTCNEIIRFLGNIEYYDARKIAIPLVAASYYVFLCATVSQEEYYVKKTYWVSIVLIITVLINIILCITVIPIYGAMGAAFCAMLSYMLMLVLHGIIIKFFLKSQTFNWSNIIIDSTIVMIMTFVALMVSDLRLIRWLLVLTVSVLATLFGVKIIKKYRLY